MTEEHSVTIPLVGGPLDGFKWVGATGSGYYLDLEGNEVDPSHLDGVERYAIVGADSATPTMRYTPAPNAG